MGQEGRVVSKSDGGDHAVDQAAWRDPCAAAAPVNPHRAVEVDRSLKAQQFETSQQSPQIPLSSIVAGAGKHLGDDRLGYG